MNRFSIIPCLLLFFSSFVSCTEESNEPLNEEIVAVSMLSFTPATGSFYPKDNVTSSLIVKNSGNTRWKYWIGCSLKNKMENWYDLPVDTISLSPGQVSGIIRMKWIVPSSTPITSGDYSVRVAIWKDDPSGVNPERLTYIDSISSFSVFNLFEQFETLDENIWSVINKSTPGYGLFKAQNIIIQGGTLSILYPKNTKDGGEVRSASSSFKYGSYRASIRPPSQLPGTYTTFFLYNSVTLDEIDIELWNDNSRQVTFTTWVAEKKRYSKSVILNYNPSEQFHEYRIDYYPSETSFWVDNVKIGSTNVQADIPKSNMSVYINGWWPKWMTGTTVQTDKYAVYEWIKF